MHPFAVRGQPIEMLPQMLEMRLVRRLVLRMIEAVTVLCLERRMIGPQGGVLFVKIGIGHHYFFLSVSSNHATRAA